MDSLLHNWNHPDPEYSATPFWLWNGDLEPGELLRQIALMQEAGVEAFVIHARRGLTVEYLSETWFERCRLAIEEAARRGMKVWIYDEDNWPSGYAGGRVLQRDPDLVGQNLIIERHYLEGPSEWRLKLEHPEQVLCVQAGRIREVLPQQQTNPFSAVTGVTQPWYHRSAYRHVYDGIPCHLEMEKDLVWWQVPQGRWCVGVVRQQPTQWQAAYSEQLYTDVLNPRTVEVFIEETHQRYFEHFKEHFGQTIQGFFVDEPGFYNNAWDRNPESIPWAPDFAVEFIRRRGYDPIPRLLALWEDLEGAHELRLDYWQTAAELFAERFIARLANWCKEHGVRLAGHLMLEEWLFTNPRHSANPFTALAPMHIPGVDKIDEVGRKITEKLAASVAHAQGRRRVVSESFALIGWKLAPPYMKQIVDQQFVRGINFLIPHAFFYSIQDNRKNDAPPSAFFQNPWWSHSPPLWRYVTRLSLALSQGQHAAPLVLYYPLEAAWAAMTPADPPSFGGGPYSSSARQPWQLPHPQHPVQKCDAGLIELATALLEWQYDFDLLDYSLLKQAKLMGGTLELGQERFSAMVVPWTPYLRAEALDQMLTLAASGGTLLFMQALPELLGPPPANWLAWQARLGAEPSRWHPIGSGRVGLASNLEVAWRLLSEAVPRDLEARLEQDPLRLFVEPRRYANHHRLQRTSHAIKYHRRRLGEANLYFVVNESDQTLQVKLRLRGGPRATRLDLRNGQAIPIAATPCEGRVEVGLAFGPWESHLLYLEDAPTLPVPAQRVLRQERLEGWHLSLDQVNHQGELLPWGALGLSRFAGLGLYHLEFDLPSLPTEQRVILDLGQVFETARIGVNGNWLEPLAWAPYQVEITPYLRIGRNSVEVEVANTLAGAFEEIERPSGLLGPVQLFWIEDLTTDNMVLVEPFRM